MPSIPIPDAITVPTNYLPAGSPESAYLDLFAHVFRRPPEVLEIHEIVGTGNYLIGPAGVGVRFSAQQWIWQTFPTRIQYGYQAVAQDKAGS